MHFKKLKSFHILIVLCLISIILLLIIFTFSGTRQQTGKATAVSIIGYYNVDGQEKHDLSDGEKIDTNELHTVTISGHFSSDIPKDWVLMLLLDNIKASIKINGREVYSSNMKGTKLNNSKTAGNMWGFYVSPGISVNDNIKIVLKNVYTKTVTNVFDEFLTNISYGHGFELYQTLMREKIASLIAGFSIMVIGIIAFVLCFVAAVLKAPGMSRGMALSCITTIGGCWIFINGGYPYISLLFDNPLLFNAIDILEIFVISVAMVIYTFTCLENKTTKKTAKMIAKALLILLICAVIMQITGLYDLYEIQGWAIAIGSIAIFTSIVLLGYEAFVLKHRQTFIILVLWLPLFISGLMEVVNFYVRFMYKRAAVQYGFALAILLQFIQLVCIIHGNVKKMQKVARLEYELLQSRMSVMLSQIQPHFLMNTLNDIRFLYRESPKQAEEALVSFTRYLRGNMASLNQMDLIPFEQELNHIKNYVAIEKIRFGTRLNFVFDIDCTNFFLPVLTIQPLVENAIRHGVIAKREGGTVTIRTMQDTLYFSIMVQDDGAGFDQNFKKEDGEVHTGIDNVRMRLKSMCEGNLIITSRIGEGTISLVQIPKQK